MLAEHMAETDGPLTESQLLKGAPRCLREEEPDEDDLEDKPAAVGEQPLPCDVLQSNGVDEGGEESGASAEELEDGDATRAFCIWE